MRRGALTRRPSRPRPARPLGADPSDASEGSAAIVPLTAAASPSPTKASDSARRRAAYPPCSATLRRTNAAAVRCRTMVVRSAQSAIARRPPDTPFCRPRSSDQRATFRKIEDLKPGELIVDQGATGDRGREKEGHLRRREPERPALAAERPAPRHEADQHDGAKKLCRLRVDTGGGKRSWPLRPQHSPQADQPERERNEIAWAAKLRGTVPDAIPSRTGGEIGERRRHAGGPGSPTNARNTASSGRPASSGRSATIWGIVPNATARPR